MWTLFQPNWDVYIQRSVWLPLSEGWGASCPGWFILPPTQDLGQTVSSVNSYCTIILDYLVVRDVNIISAKLRCLQPTFSLVTLGTAPRLFILPPPPPPPPRIWVKQCHQLILIKRCEHYFSQTETFISNIQFGYPCPKGGGQAVQAGLSCPPPRIWVKQCHQLILIAP